MVYGQQEGGSTRRLKEKFFPWLVAVLLGLAISVSDIHFPNERRGAEQGGGYPDSTASRERPGAGFLDREDPAGRDQPFLFAYEPKPEPDLLPFDRAVHEAAGRYHVEVELILAIIMAESRFDPRAKSKKGARGLMQLMPVTASAYEVSDAFDPTENIDAGTRYLRDLLDRFGGDLRLALAAYNAGEQAVIRHKGVPPFPETRAYIEKVLQYYRLIKEDRLDFDFPLTLSSAPSSPAGFPVIVD
ncbi:MAG: lytic transglycosylase domain-containing protein [Desulfobacterales bacterium]